jgi:hypothetical protein
MKFIMTALLLMLMASTLPSYAQMECKCHSKQPAMRRMHEIIGFSGCQNCHTKRENLMSGDRKTGPERKSDLARRIREDKTCIPCHESEGTVKKEIYSNRTMMEISGTLYCPKDKMKYSSGTKTCSKCGGPLLDINALMAQSRTNPSNEICRKCHMKEEVQQIRQHIALSPDVMNRCLDCHKGHNDCGSCHH